jgi:predicted CopG family antitoxin
MRSCYHAHMKTITLTDEAYTRLFEWKHNAKESFSQVVLKVVPPRGTATDLLRIMEQLPPLTHSAHQKMMDAYDVHRNPSHYEKNEDAWTQ